MHLTQALRLVALCASLVGCVTVPVKEHAPETPATEERALEAMSAAWNSVGVTREGRPSMVLLTPFSVPEQIRAKQVRIELEAGATVTDLVAILANLGHSIILADPSVGQKSFFLPRYRGTLGGLLSAVTRAADVWFTYHDGVIHVTGSEKVTLTLPQEEGLAEKVSAGLTSLGVQDSTVSWEAGMVTVPLTPSQLAKVQLFLQRMSANASLVTLQVAVLNVVLNQSASTGIDWGGLQFAIGTGHREAINGGLGLRAIDPRTTPRPGTTGTTGTTGTAGTTGTTGTSTPAATASAVTGLVGGALWSGNSLRGVISSNVFSFVGLVNFLQTYGTTETKQNVVLKTVAGGEVKLESVTEIPYVSNIGVTTTGNTNANNVLGSASTSKAKDGLTLKLTPTFDAAADSVTVTMDLSIDAVLGFTDLQAGSQLGQLSQPTTARRSFNDVLRLRPGQTVVVGGITYDSVGTNSGAPVFLSKDWENRTLTVTRQAMFIVVRPSVTVLGQTTKEQGEELFGEGHYVEEPKEGSTAGKKHAIAKPAAKPVRREAATAAPETPAPPALAPKAIPASAGPDATPKTRPAADAGTARTHGAFGDAKPGYRAIDLERTE